MTRRDQFGERGCKIIIKYPYSTAITQQAMQNTPFSTNVTQVKELRIFYSTGNNQAFFFALTKRSDKTTLAQSKGDGFNFIVPHSYDPKLIVLLQWREVPLETGRGTEDK